VRSGKWLYHTTHTYCQEHITGTGKKPERTVYVEKSPKADQLEISNKVVTAVRFESNGTKIATPPKTRREHCSESFSSVGPLLATQTLGHRIYIYKKGKGVENIGVEPMTFCVQGRRSGQLS
jgi:hypothetical protein